MASLSAARSQHAGATQEHQHARNAASVRARAWRLDIKAQGVHQRVCKHKLQLRCPPNQSGCRRRSGRGRERTAVTTAECTQSRGESDTGVFAAVEVSGSLSPAPMASHAGSAESCAPGTLSAEYSSAADNTCSRDLAKTARGGEEERRRQRRAGLRGRPFALLPARSRAQRPGHDEHG